jgi:hypothetical protein
MVVIFFFWSAVRPILPHHEGKVPALATVLSSFLSSFLSWVWALPATNNAASAQQPKSQGMRLIENSWSMM